MSQYGRVHKDDSEKATRYSIFKKNVARIDAFNSQTGKSYKLGVNQLADLTNEEFKASRNRFKGHMCSPQAGPLRYENVSAVPSTMDWRKEGAVTPVKDQGQCGKCLYILVFITRMRYFSNLPFFCCAESKRRLLLGIFGSGSHGRNQSAYTW